jgi:Zn-dependent protease
MLSAREIIDIAIMTFAVGYIFMDFLLPPALRMRFEWRSLWFACLVTAPALIAHELAHKFTALVAGLEATFHAAYLWLGIGVALKLLHTPFIFFVPGYVSIGCASLPCDPSPVVLALTAFAGPALNGALWLVSQAVLNYRRLRSRKWLVFWAVTRRINGFLFILNMLPIPGIDGFSVYTNLFKAFF